MVSITTAQLEALLRNLIPRQVLPLIAGPPGIGKTAIVQQIAQEIGYRCLIFHPVTDDPTNYRGFPWLFKDKDTGGGKPTAEFVTYGDFATLCETTEPTVAFFDDLGHAPKSVQATLMQPLRKPRTLNNTPISERVSFVCATNRRGDKAGVDGIIDPLISGSHVFDVRPDLDSFCAYWLRTNKRPEVMAYLRFRPDHLYVQKKSADIENFPCGRTWEFVNDDLSSTVGNELELPLFSGSLGEGVAGEFCTFLRVYREMPDIDEILRHPGKATIPSNLSVLHALCVALAYRTTNRTFPAIAAYLDKLVAANKEEVAVYLLNDAVLRHPEVKTLPECSRIFCGRLGKLILGA